MMIIRSYMFAAFSAYSGRQPRIQKVREDSCTAQPANCQNRQYILYTKIGIHVFHINENVLRRCHLLRQESPFNLFGCVCLAPLKRQELHSNVIVELCSHFIIDHLELCPGVVHYAGQFVFKALFCAFRIAQSDNKSFTTQGALKDGNRLYTKIWLHNEGKP